MEEREKKNITIMLTQLYNNTLSTTLVIYIDSFKSQTAPAFQNHAPPHWTRHQKWSTAAHHTQPQPSTIFLILTDLYFVVGRGLPGELQLTWLAWVTGGVRHYTTFGNLHGQRVDRFRRVDAHNAALVTKLT